MTNKSIMVDDEFAWIPAASENAVRELPNLVYEMKSNNLAKPKHATSRCSSVCSMMLNLVSMKARYGATSR